MPGLGGVATTGGGNVGRAVRAQEADGGGADGG